MVESTIESKSNVSDALMNDNSRVETSIDTDGKDIFDDVFEEDDDEKAAKVKLVQKAAELKKQKAKQELKTAENNTGGEKNKNVDSDDEDDDADEEEEEDSADWYGFLFGTSCFKNITK